MKCAAIELVCRNHPRRDYPGPVRPPPTQIVVERPGLESSGAGELHADALTEPDVRLSPHPALTAQPVVSPPRSTGRTSLCRGQRRIQRLRLRHALLPSRVDVCPRSVGSAPSLHPHDRASSLLRADPSLRSASVLGLSGFLPLELLPCHRSARFPRSAWKPESGSRRLSADQITKRDLVSMASGSLSTDRRRFTCVRLPDLCLTGSSPPFHGPLTTWAVIPTQHDCVQSVTS